MRFLGFAGAALGAAAVLAHSPVAAACGGCFHVPGPDKPVVTDHRMVFSISSTQSVLWDQIRYSGNPTDFAWVLPVKAGARVEASNEGWFAALDAATQPVVYAPPTRTGTAGGCAGGTVGCGSAGGGGAGSSEPPPGVQVLGEGTAGIYDTVTLRSSDPNALVNWLDSNAYDIPDPIRPTLAAYVSGGFDFIALRIRPDCEVRAMQPVRVVTPGADPTLPLRMVAAGVGANVGVTLWVLGEGRYHPRNFPDGQVDFTQLVWDGASSASNYESLVLQGMQGSAWVTEAAFNVNEGPPGGSASNPTLYAACAGSGAAEGGVAPPPCVNMQGPAAEAGSDDSGDAGADAGDDAGSFGTPVCGDDLALAMTGLNASDVWVTRLRAFLPNVALEKDDLDLEAAPSQTPVSNVHQAATIAGAQPSACESSPATGDPAGTWAIVVAAGMGVAAITRRRRDR